MYDQQLAVHLSEQRGMGMLSMLRDQLGVESPTKNSHSSSLESYWRNPTTLARRYHSNAAQANEIEPVRAEQPAHKIDSPEEFVASLWSAAEGAANELGLPTEALLAQAALETGWGGHVMRSAQGGSSHNLFGIKADQRWDGEQVRKETLEYQQDVAVRKRENFRSYNSYQESFQDYVAFLKQNPRYAEALRNTQDSEAYFRALQDAGYATDPNYADKILRVMRGEEMQAALDQFKSPARRPI
jgi:flagellar protein FlgJ